MSGQGGTKRINGDYYAGEGTPGKYRLNITHDRKWFIEYTQDHPEPVMVSNPQPGKPTHTVRLERDVDLVEYRLCDVAQFISKGSKKKNSSSTTSPGDDNYDDWIGDPTSRGIGC